MREGMVVGGRYRLEEDPVRGGGGEIWRAFDIVLRRRVVLKRVLVGGGEFDRLQAEAHALARSDHSHVVTLYDVVHHKAAEEGEEDTSWLVMEHLSGGSLESARMAPEEAARVGARIADALTVLHERGLVHMDVKPANVVIDAQGSPKLADFGAAYRFGDEETINPNGPVSYTPAYAAPEVIRGMPRPASDVFSLGATVYTLATGKSVRGDGPQARDSTGDAMAEWKAERGLLRLDAGLGPLSGVLAAMLRGSPGERPDAAEARRLLRAVAEGRDPYGPDDGARDPWWRRVPRFIRRPVVLVAGATAAVAVAVLIPVLGGGGTGDAPSVIGDHRTVDLCSLAEPSALAKFGEAQRDPAYGNFNRCDVLVDVGEDDPVDVQVRFDDGRRPTQLAVEKTVKWVDVADGPAEGDACARTLLPASDDVDIIVSAEQPDGKGPLCDIAEAAADSAVDRLNKGRLPRRSPEPAQNSLVRQDACALLGPDALKSVPGIDAKHPRVDYGNWGCRWAGATGDTSVWLRFDQGQPPTAEDGTLTEVGGRRAIVLPEWEGPHTCLIKVFHRSYPDQHGDPGLETLNVNVGGDGSPEQLRRTATELATAAAAELPPL